MDQVLQDKIIEAIDSRREEMFTLLSEMVKIPSVSGDEARMAEYVNAYCQKLGFESSIDRHGNVLAIVRGSRPGKRIAFNSHLDTVEIGDGWEDDPFSGKIVGDRMYGRGSTDCKGPMAAQMIAVRALLDAGIDLPGEVALCYPVCEEVPFVERKGTLKMINDGFTADMCINGEDTDLRVCLACEGMLEVKITTIGLNAHAATNYKGRNAIRMMCRVIDEIDKIEPGYNEYTGKGTITPGIISGGERSSVVPDRCELRVSRFTVPGETGEMFLAQIQEILDRLKEEIPGFDAVCELTYNSNPSLVDADSDIVQAVIRAHKRLGLECPLTGTPQHDDADFLSNVAGIPTVIFGPGTGLIAHMPNEYVLLEELETAAKLNALIICEALGV